MNVAIIISTGIFITTTFTELNEGETSCKKLRGCCTFISLVFVYATRALIIFQEKIDKQRDSFLKR